MNSREAALAGQTLFISGASRGIGKAIALRAARDGANIVVAAKTEGRHPKLPGTIHETVAEIEAAGGNGLAVRVDVREDESRNFARTQRQPSKQQDHGPVAQPVDVAGA